MNPISRRDFLQGLAALPLVLGLPQAADAATLRIRYDLASASGQQMLEVYADAVRAMQAMGEDNPMGWLWQWYTHFVNGTTTKSAELTRIFGTASSSPKSLATETWNTCQSHSGQNANHFLPWHRMFVYYFERLVRQASGRSDFTLPYWDYTSTDPAKRGIVPQQFRLPDDPLFGSLYRANRSSVANGGQRLDVNQPADMMGIDDAMAKTSYSTVGSVTGFCRAIDSGIHGRIHTLVGTTKGMGAVPYAGNDPLFWVHHSNIDRMWTSWNRNGGTNPSTASWSYNQFVFVDAGPVRVKKALRSFFSATTLGYGYDQYIAPPTSSAALAAQTTGLAPTAAAATAGGPGQRIAAAPGAAELGAAPTRVLLQPLGAARSSSVLGLDDRASGGRAYLVLRDLHTWAQPGVLFHVYVGPGRGKALLDPAHYAGNINFFDAEFHDHGGGAMATALGENLFSFDITPILEGLRRGGGNGARDALVVTIVPAGRPEGGSPMVGSIELVRQ